MKAKPRRAVFLDRDGTLITERGYLSDPKKMVFYPNVFGPLAQLKKKGFKLIVVSNQSGVGRGYFSLSTLSKINIRFKSILAQHGVRLDAAYYCPHLPEAGCPCRKPKPFFPKKAARKMNIDLSQSFMIGDQERDILMAEKMGSQGILVLTGGGRKTRAKLNLKKVKVVKNIQGACTWILSQKEISLS